MGTKNNPGEFDCYENAEPDEPMFVLLGRDKHAAALVRIWAMLRVMDDEEEPEKIDEANSCASQMENWLAKKKGSCKIVPPNVINGVATILHEHLK